MALISVRCCGSYLHHHGLNRSMYSDSWFPAVEHTAAGLTRTRMPLGDDGLMDKATFEAELAGLVGASKLAQPAIFQNKRASAVFDGDGDRNGDRKISLAGLPADSALRTFFRLIEQKWGIPAGELAVSWEDFCYGGDEGTREADECDEGDEGEGFDNDSDSDDASYLPTPQSTPASSRPVSPVVSSEATTAGHEAKAAKSTAAPTVEAPTAKALPQNMASAKRAHLGNTGNGGDHERSRTGKSDMMSLRKTLKSRVANLRRNGDGHSVAQRLLVPPHWTYGALLEAATRKFKLVKAARLLYTVEGVKIESLEQIEDKTELLVSCGEPFTRPPARRLPVAKRSTMTPLRDAAHSVQRKPNPENHGDYPPCGSRS